MASTLFYIYLAGVVGTTYNITKAVALLLFVLTIGRSFFLLISAGDRNIKEMRELVYAEARWLSPLLICVAVVTCLMPSKHVLYGIAAIKFSQAVANTPIGDKAHRVIEKAIDSYLLHDSKEEKK